MTEGVLPFSVEETQARCDFSQQKIEKAADGKATKIIIPSEIQGMAGLAKSLVEVAADVKEK